jgi:hypothetical protein
LRRAFHGARDLQLLDAIASRAEIVSESTHDAIAGAATVTPIVDERDWKRRYRLTQLVDHCDMFLVRMRGRRWFARYVDVEANGRRADHSWR